MTQIFDPDGTVPPATVIKAGPCVVVQAKARRGDGYEAVQLALVEDKPAKVAKPLRGQLQKSQCSSDARAARVRVAREEILSRRAIRCLWRCSRTANASM
jgi:large subunit ribosomal protein L3